MRCPMRKFYTICLTFALLCTVADAAKKYPMNAASIVPGARAEVAIDKDKNGNTKREIGDAGGFAPGADVVGGQFANGLLLFDVIEANVLPQDGRRQPVIG